MNVITVRRRSFALIVTTSILAIAACKDDPTGPPNSRVVAVEVSPTADTLTAIDQTLQLTAVGRDGDGNEVTGVTFAWASSDPAIVAVNSTGLVTAVAGGFAEVTASVGSASSAAGVDVIQEVTAVELSPAVYDLRWIGARTQVTATAYDANAHSVPDVAFEWRSLEPDVATVDPAGIVTARSVGRAEVRATFEELSGVVGISVSNGGSGSVPYGLAYTLWFPRSELAPALLVDDSLVILRHPDRKNGWYNGAVEARDFPDTPWGERNVAKFQFFGNSIGLLTDVLGGAGTLRVRGRVGDWRTLALGTAVDFQLGSGGIVWLEEGGRLRTTTPLLPATLESTGVVDFKLTPFGVIWLRDDGIVRVAPNILPALRTWTAYEEGGVRQIHLGPGGFLGRQQLVGLLLENGEFRVRRGQDADWEVLVESGVVDSRMEGERIALLHDDGTLRVRDFYTANDWTQIASGDIRQIELEGNRIAILRGNGEFLVREDFDKRWITLSNEAQEIQLQGPYVGMLSQSGELSIKSDFNGNPDLNGAWTTSHEWDGSVSQFQLIASVPYPPVRTTPVDYERTLAVCSNDPSCISPWQDAAGWTDPSTWAAEWYGRYCGAGRPADWDGAHELGPIDGLDAICHHHDHAEQWYPQVKEVDFTGGCVVRWALRYSRLTRNGEVLATGWDHVEDEWDDWDLAWNGQMENLRDAIDEYFDATWWFCSDDEDVPETGRLTEAPIY